MNSTYRRFASHAVGMMRDIFDESRSLSLPTVPSNVTSRPNPSNVREHRYPEQHPLSHAQSRGLVQRTVAFSRLTPLTVGNDWGVLQKVCRRVARYLQGAAWLAPSSLLADRNQNLFTFSDVPDPPTRTRFRAIVVSKIAI